MVSALKKYVPRRLEHLAQKSVSWLSSSSIAGRLASGILWSVIGAGLSRGLTLVSFILVARILGLEMFGELGKVQSTVGMFQVFTGLGFGITAAKFVAQYRVTDPAKAGRILGMATVLTVGSGIITTLVLLAAAPWLASETLKADYLITELRIGSLLVLFGAICGAQTGSLSGLEAFRAIARVNTLTGILSFPLLVAGTWWGGLNGAVWGLVLGMVINVLLNQAELHRLAQQANIPVCYTSWLQEWRILLSFGLPVLISTFLTAPVQWLCNVFLIQSREDASAQIALLNAATHWRNMLLFLPGMVAQVTLPLLSRHSTDEAGSGAFQRAYELSSSLVLLAILPAGTVIMFCSGWIMALYGSDFQGQSAPMIGLMSAAMILGAGMTASPVLQARDRMWLGLCINLSYSVFFLVGVYLYAASGGATAVGLVSAVSYLACGTWTFLVLRQELTTTMALKQIGYFFLIVLITGLALACPDRARLILAIPVALGVTVILLLSCARKELRAMIGQLAKARAGSGKPLPEAAVLPTETVSHDLSA